MAGNRVKGVRAAVFYNGPDEIIKLSRQHNNANILSLGARFMSEEECIGLLRYGFLLILNLVDIKEELKT